MISKIAITSLLSIFLSFSAAGQDSLKINTSSNRRLIKALNNAQQLGEDREGWISVRVYKLDNGSGSAGIPEGHEVSENLLLAVSEYDEQPKQNLFEIGTFLDPKLLSIEASKFRKFILIEHGMYDKRRELKLEVTIDQLTIVK